jgi:hypothetical protein
MTSVGWRLSEAVREAQAGHTNKQINVTPDVHQVSGLTETNPEEESGTCRGSRGKRPLDFGRA